MSKKTITITDLKDVQDGDMVTVKIEGRQYTGPAYTRGDDILVWGGRALRYSHGEPYAYLTFVSATRETPSLPTKAGSVILVHEADGKVCDPPVLAMHDGTNPVPWGVTRQIGSLGWLRDENITRWQECDVTPRGEVVER